MPRMTRAALRAQAQDQDQYEPQGEHQIHEDSDADAVDLVLHGPETSLETNQDSTSRPALKDITYENNLTSDDVFIEEMTIPAKNAKSNKRGKQQEKEEEEDLRGIQGDPVTDETAPIPQDSQHTDSIDSSFTLASDSIQEVPPQPELISEQSYTESLDVTHQPPHTPEEVCSPPPQACSTVPKTPKFDPAIHAPEPCNATPATDTVEDSFLDKIKTRSPSKMRSHSNGGQSPDSTAELVTSRTPRIEDSVEAIDALEDAIEKISQGLPSLNGLDINSPAPPTKKTPARLNLDSASRTPSTLKKSTRTPARTPRQAPDKAPASQPRPTRATAASGPPSRPASKPPVGGKIQKKQSVAGPIPKEHLMGPTPALSFSSSPVKPLPNTTKKRVPSGSLSTSRPGFVPAKSSKAPTKSTFTLPGEAISAKLKAQLDEKLKREEEAKKARQNFKARPIPTKVAEPSVKPRENKASQARLSIYAGGVNKENVEPQAKASVRKPRPVSMIDTKTKVDTAKANSGVRRTTSVLERPTTMKARVSSIQLSAGQKSSVSEQEAVQQKAKGKEVFGRNKAELERLEKERKEKEEAARKARAEAAERGRQASREWAEKQKKKMLLQASAKLAGGRATEGSSTAVSTAS